MSHCKTYFNHEPLTVCADCDLDVDAYGNTSEDFINCSFPDCGCDGARLCMAKNGASDDCLKGNVEAMYRRNDAAARRARGHLMHIVHKRG